MDISKQNTVVKIALFFSIFFSLITVLQYAQEKETNTVKDIGKKLIAAAYKADPTECQQLLKQIGSQYRDNKIEFFKIMDFRDDEGYNVLQLFTLTSDLENLAAVYDVLKQVYKNDIESLFKFLMTRDRKGGSTIVGLSQDASDRRVMAFTLMRLVELLGSNKEYFFEIMYAADLVHGWRPLINATDDSESLNVKMMVTVAAHVLGRSSKLFKRYITQVDADGDSALDLAKTRRDELLLASFGGQRTKKGADVQLEKVRALARNLIKISNNTVIDTTLFSNALEEAIAACNKDVQLIYYVFYEQDDAGWNIMMHTAAGGQYQYMELLIDSMKKNIPEDGKMIKTLIFASSDMMGRTPLHLAIFRRNFKIASLILETMTENPPDIPFLFSILKVPTEFNGFTPLITGIYTIGGKDTHGVAFLEELFDIAGKLFKKGSRMMHQFVNIRDYNGLTALAYAISGNIRQLLKSYGAVDEPLRSSIGVEDFEKIMQMYIDFEEHQDDES